MTAPTIQEMMRRLSTFWSEQGCILHEGYDLEVGAGTFNPSTFLRCLGPEPYQTAYIEPCRRPGDGRYGENPNRMQHYFQYQVLMKPSPLDLQEKYLASLEAIGIPLEQHDIRFVHDDWESPTLGAWGLGWEVWCDGMEVTQYTYFQSVAGISLKPVSGELTYGLERLAMYIQEVDDVYDLQWNDKLTYGDLFKRNEWEFSHYNFQLADAGMWQRHFEDYEREAKRLLGEGFPLPAYDFVMKASHAFNLLDARGVISVTERTGYIQRIRDLSCLAAEGYLKSREELGHPLTKYWPATNASAEVEAEATDSIDTDPRQSDDFLLEIGSEELPAEFVPIGCSHLKKALESLFSEAGLSYGQIEVMGTPRRLSALVTGLVRGIEPQMEERKGPLLSVAFDADGQVSKAGGGFFRSIGLENPPTLKELEEGKIPLLSTRDIKGKTYLFATVQKKDFDTATWVNLQKHLPKLILSLDFPKKMRWADFDISYARPLRWIVALHGEDVIPFSVGPIHSGRESRGHRQLENTHFTIDDASEYVDLLRSYKVMVDINERRHFIEKQLDDIEAAINARVLVRHRVLPQVLHLSEWPLLTETAFDSSFLRAPKEVLISEMVEHQKYFPVSGTDGELINRFIITADNTPNDVIRSGNRKVLSARLSDGLFLYDQDLKVTMEEWNEKLKHITFQKKLGTVYDKVKRLCSHVRVLHDIYCSHNPDLEPGDLADIERAALLCKADLASDMVGEFPELQGTIGRYYATAHGENEDVACAIEEHWMPRREKDSLPKSLCGIFVSLAEKIDNLLGCFLVGLKPKSSSDPYGLRRQVLAIVRILIEQRWHLPILTLFRRCAEAYPAELTSELDEVLKEVEAFITNRIKTVFQDYYVSKDEIEASLANGLSDIYDTYCKTQALNHIRHKDPRFPLLFEVYKRAKGQLEGQAPQVFKPELLSEKAEYSLHKAMESVEMDFQKAIKERNYDKAYLLIAELQPSLAELFDEVRILHDDESIKNNRIALLQRVFALFGQLLDLGRLQQEKQKLTAKLI